MRDSPAIGLFHENWFLRDAELPEITRAEGRFIEAAMGQKPGRWDGQPDLARMSAALANFPAVLDRIGAHLLTVIVGMRGCGGAVSFLLDRGVPFNIGTRSYNFGVGKHHELPIKGNGERGVTSLHEAVAPGLWGDDSSRNLGKREVALRSIAQRTKDTPRPRKRCSPRARIRTC